MSPMIVPGGVDLSGSILANEVTNFPSLELADDTQPFWWLEKDANATLTEVDLAGEAGVTESYERAHKVVVATANSYAYQRYIYADSPRIKSGARFSAKVAVWSVSNAPARIRLQSSVGSLGVSATTTAAGWTILTVDGVTLDGTYVELREEVDVGTAYFVPLGVHVGTRALALPPRGLIFRWIEPTVIANLAASADPDTWTDANCNAATSPRAAIALVEFFLFEVTSNYQLGFRRNGSSGGSAEAVGTIPATSEVAHNTFPVILDQDQVFEYKLNRTAGASALDAGSVSVHGYWEWE